MSREPERDEPEGHPLRGVLDRLLTRERGEEEPPADCPEHPRVQPPPASGPAGRRMLVLAGVGGAAGDGFLRALAGLAVQAGRRSAILDLAAGGDPGDGDASDGEEGASVPMAVIPCGLERLRAEPAEVVAAVLERLRRLEADADLLVVRIPVRYRMVLMRAAFLAGGLVVPLDGSDSVLGEAFRLARDLRENFRDLRIWPLSVAPSDSDRFLEMCRDFLDCEPVPLQAAGKVPRDLLEGLAPPPEEGFATALLDAGGPTPPAHLLRVGSLKL